MYDLSARNPLVHSNEKKLWFVDLDDNNASKIYKQQQSFLKEYGLETSLLVSHFIRWKSTKKNSFYTSPLIYQPIQIVKNQKIKLLYTYKIKADQHFINPILQHEFKSQFNIDLSFNTLDSEAFIKNIKSQLTENGDAVKITSEWNDIEEWQIISTKAIGTFNYKKSILGKDFDTIIESPSSSIHSILGESSTITNTENEELDLSYSDVAQKQAINLAMTSNVVIQGPPGTGKSHTIVELIKQNLLANKTILFVSEKRSALDVVYNKLKDEGLQNLVAFFNSEKHQKKEFYRQLKNLVVNNNSLTEPKAVDANKMSEIEAYFKSYVHTLTAKNEKLDHSIFDLVNFLAEHQVDDLQYDVTTKIPSYKQWFNYIDFLEDIELIGTKNFNCNTLANLPFISLNKSAFLDQNPLSKIELRLNELENWIKEITSVYKTYNVDWSWSNLAKFATAASVLNTANKSQLDILEPNTKSYKSFDIWTKKYELTLNKLQLSNEFCSKWIKKPKLAEIDQLIEELQNETQKKWYHFYKTSKRTTIFKDYKGELSTPLKIEALNNLKENYLLRSALAELEIKLKHNLNLLNPKVDINQILHIRQKLDTLSSNQYIELLEHKESLMFIEDLHGLQPKIQKSNQILKFLFVDLKIESLKDISQLISNVRFQSPKFKHYLPEIKKTLNLPHELLSFIKSNSHQMDDLTKIVVYHNYLDSVRFEPNLKTLTSIDILPHYKKLKQLKKSQNTHKKEYILHNWEKNKRKTEDLLQTPASKLSDIEKIEKQRQKAAKRIIFHEIAKKQQHLPIKSLIKDTDKAILDILPVWIMNPLTIAESLPCLPDLFDTIIFDESSQIPLEDALPAIYRAKQLTVVGDSKQMPPSQFFSASTESITLLNQAESVFKSKLLSWHYRSQHPDLIQFSNSNFYDNELSFFPPVSKVTPIDFVKVEKGIFDTGKNKLEAKEVAKQYSSLLERDIRNVGIIAFSKEQEKQITTEITKLNLSTNEELLVRNLENSQGIERDIIIISVGYAFNPEGSFRMNFGPLNQDYGANRLNVLLTRSKQKMIIVSSVNSSDFKLSENRGVQLLKSFLFYAEQNSSSKNEIPENFLQLKVYNLLKHLDVSYYASKNGASVNCFIQHSTQKVLLLNPSLQKSDNKDIYTILSVLDDRFKSIKVLLSHDYWNNKSRFESDILNYFS